jgi:hypothetical protein
MKTFAQLFEERRGVLDNGAYARSMASGVFRGTDMLLNEGVPLAPTDGAVLGVAFYSLPDLVVLDKVVDRCRKSHKPHMRIEVSTF